MSSWLRFGHDIGVIGEQVYPNASPRPRRAPDGAAAASQWRAEGGDSVVAPQEEGGGAVGGLRGATMSLNEMQLIFTGVNSRHVHDPAASAHALQHSLSFAEFLEGLVHIACALYRPDEPHIVDGAYLSAALNALLLGALLPHARRED
eukprot:4504915-Prymnesium_polylepis.1